MNSNQRSQGNNQSDNGGNVKPEGTMGDKNSVSPPQSPSMQSGGDHQRLDQQSTERTGSQTGSEQKDIGERVSNEAAGGLPRSPRGKQLSADEKMNDDTGLSNTANR